MGTQDTPEITKKALNTCFLHVKSLLNAFNSLIHIPFTPNFWGTFSYALNGIKGYVSALFFAFFALIFPLKGSMLAKKSPHLSPQLSLQPHFCPFLATPKSNEMGTFGQPFFCLQHHPFNTSFNAPFNARFHATSSPMSGTRSIRQSHTRAPSSPTTPTILLTLAK